MTKDKEIQNLVKICFVKHRSAKSLVYSWCCLDKKTSINEIVNLKQFTNKKETGPVKKAIDIIESKKFWGFYRKGKISEIHIWSHKSCKVKEIAGVLAHEIAHASGYLSERSAIKISTICQFALYILLLNYKDKISKKVI